MMLTWLNSWVQCKGDFNRQASVCTFTTFTWTLTFKVLTAQGFLYAQPADVDALQAQLSSHRVHVTF